MERPDFHGLGPFDMIAITLLYLSWVGVSTELCRRVNEFLQREPYPTLQSRCEQFIVLAATIAETDRLPGQRRWWQFWRKRDDQLSEGAG